MRDLLSQGAALQIESTLTVRPKDGQALSDTFTCILQKQPKLNYRPCHVREDIIIPNVDTSRVAGYTCIVRIDDGPLATLLGDSEGPAHTEWQASSRNFKDKYVYGGMAIEFVSMFPSELLRRIHATSKELDRTLLLDLFQDKGPEPVEERPVPAPAPGPNLPPEPPSLEPRGPKLQIVPTATGFTVSSVGNGHPIGAILRVRAAYETSKGNPFSVYNEHDFRFTDDGFSVAGEGCDVDIVAPNEIRLTITGSSFSLSVSGFDINRDVIVRASEVRTQSNDEQELGTDSAD